MRDLVLQIAQQDDIVCGSYTRRLCRTLGVQWNQRHLICTSTMRLTGATGSPVLELASSSRSQFKLSSIAYTSGEKVEDEPRRTPCCVDMHLMSDLQDCTASSMSTAPWWHRRRVNLRPREGGMSGSHAVGSWWRSLTRSPAFARAHSFRCQMFTVVFSTANFGPLRCPDDTPVQPQLS